MTITARLLRDRTRGLVGWSLGMVAIVVLTVAFYPAVKDQGEILDQMINAMPDALKAAVGYDAAVPLTSPAGYLNARLFAILAPVLAVIFAIGLGAQAVGGLEEAGQLEPLLANPVTRVRVALERYAAGVALLAVLIAVLAASTVGLSAPFGALDGVSLGGVAGACAAAGCLALLHGSVAFAVGAATGRRSPAIAAASSVAVGGYLVQSLHSVTEALDPLRFVNPWHWYLRRNMLAEGVPLDAIVVPLAVSAVLLAAGVLAFRRRDLR